MNSIRSLFAQFIIWTLISFTAIAAPPRFLSAEQSDPNVMGWMQGYPPPEDKLITQPQSNYFSFPKMRWSVCHMREFLPTKNVSKGLGNAIPFEYQLDPEIDSIRFTPLGSDTTMTWQESLSANYTDGMLILHKGKVVYEKYLGCLAEGEKHAAMSMTKSMTGLLAQILVAEGKLDEKAKISTIIPELTRSAFGSATVRQVMDMTTNLDYSEDYSDPNADIWAYTTAADPLPKAKDYQGPNGYYEYLQTVKAGGEHGQSFGYKTVNTDVLGWIISRVTGKGYTELLSEMLWSKIGAEQDAYITIDSKGTSFAGGGLSAGLRDLGRIGQLMLNNGKLGDAQLFPASVVKSIEQGADKSHFNQAGYSTLDGGSYRSMWWVIDHDKKVFSARGVHGQTIYVDRSADMVIVRFASYPLAKNSYIDPTSLPAYQAVANYLAGKRQ